MSIDLMHEDAIRVFLALKPSLTGLDTSLAPAKCHHPEDMHLTLAFLGKCPRWQIEALIRDLNKLGPWPKCQWRSEYLGDFPNGEQAKVFAYYGGPLSESLRTILQKIQHIPLLAQHIRHPFRPHLTLAPIKKATHIEQPYGYVWHFHHMCLYKSGLGTPKYEALAHWDLV